MTRHSQIKLNNINFFLERGVEVPGSVWKQPPFKFDPHPFGTNSDHLNPKFFEGSVQNESLERFKADPLNNLVYGVGSAPNDAKAKYFAAYLLQVFMETAHPSFRPKWVRMDGSYSNPEMNTEASLLVITGLSPASTQVKVEKVRDILEKHESIPIIVVVSGEDPITYFSTRLYHPVHNVFFHSEAIVKRKLEVV